MPLRLFLLVRSESACVRKEMVIERENTGYVFLLYVSIMLLINFIQQEFVLKPELQSLDLV